MQRSENLDSWWAQTRSRSPKSTRAKDIQEGQKGALSCEHKKVKIDPKLPLLGGVRAPLKTPGPGSAACRRAISARLRERSSCRLAVLRAEVRAGGYAWVCGEVTV